MPDIAIKVQNLSKCYQVYAQPQDRLKQSIYPGLQRLVRKNPKQYFREFWALKDVSFEIEKGEAVGIIGRNGSGKSTLLQMICGTLNPTSGSIQTNGRIAALLELGSGFNPEFTGRENVYMNAAVLGFSQQETDDRFDEITHFADIGEFIEQPVKTYSSGMIMRLAFAVQVLCDPEILIIDEALSVGDFFFQQKCLSYIRGLCAKGVTLLFVSHDMGTVRDICRRAVYLRQGCLHFSGEMRLAIREYLAESSAPVNQVWSEIEAGEIEGVEPKELDTILRDAIWTAQQREHENNTGRLIAIAIYDAEGNPNTSFRLGSAMRIKVIYRPAVEKTTHVTVAMRNKFDQVVTVLGSSRLGLNPPQSQQNQLIVFEIVVNLMLEAGNYSLLVSLGNLVAPNQGENLDSSTTIGPIVIQWDYEKDAAPFLGMFGVPATGKFKMLTTGEFA